MTDHFENNIREAIEELTGLISEPPESRHDLLFGLAHAYMHLNSATNGLMFRDPWVKHVEDDHTLGLVSFPRFLPRTFGPWFKVIQGGEAFGREND